MARDEIALNYMVYDATDSVGVASIEPTTVNVGNGITIKNAFAGKDNSQKIIVNAGGDSTVTIKAGEKQNAVLGDSIVAVKTGVNVISPLRDMARYEKADGSIDLDFGAGFTGTIYAVAEKAGL